MKKIVLCLFCLWECMTLIFAQSDYLQIVSFESQQGGTVTFTSAGKSSKKKEAGINAAKSLFYTLFYSGVIGVNDDEPLVVNDRKSYTNTFFNEECKYQFYVVSQEDGEITKNAQGLYQCTSTIKIRYQQLVNDLNRTLKPRTPGAAAQKPKEIKELPMTMPSIIVVPYTTQNESYENVLSSKHAIRTAVSAVTNGFQSRNVETISLQGLLDAKSRREQYESNTVSSNDKVLLKSSGADVYVVVDATEDRSDGMLTVNVNMHAYRTETGADMASKSSFFRNQSNNVDLVYHRAVEQVIQPFLDDICKNFLEAANNGTRVAIQFSIAQGSMTAFTDPVGPKNYRLNDVIRLWVKKNAYNQDYRMRGSNAESIDYDYVRIPTTDSDGMRMTSDDFRFNLEQYIKEELNLNCDVKTEGNTIYVIFL